MSYVWCMDLEAQRSGMMGKKSWSWGRIVLDVPPIEEPAFVEDLSQWPDSSESEMADEARELIWPMLDTARIDAKSGTITWPGVEPLDIQQSVRRIHQDHPHLTEALIEDKVIAWLEMEYAPEGYSSAQMEELERWIDRWIKKHHRQTRRKKAR